MFDLGGGELLLILVAVLLLFGPKKLPELAQGLGKGLRQVKQAQRDFTEQINSALDEEDRKESAKKAKPGAKDTIARVVNNSSYPNPTKSETSVKDDDSTPAAQSESNQDTTADTSADESDGKSESRDEQ